MPYAEDDMLMLSGIQHYAFCPRQWALIHIEQQWSENLLTMEGQIMHQHVDDPFYRQKMGDHICLRAVSLASKELGLYDVSDIVELHSSDDDVDSIRIYYLNKNENQRVVTIGRNDAVDVEGMLII